MQSIIDNKFWLLITTLAAFMAGCDGGSKNNGGGDGVNTNSTTPAVLSTVPAANATLPINGNITATFNEAMDASTINTTTFTVMKGAAPVPGAVTVADTVATFNPSSDLEINSTYTATITTGAKDPEGNPLTENKTWSFTTTSAAASGSAPVVLGTAGNFVILAKQQVAAADPVIIGDVGVSPGLATDGMNGFLEEMDGSNTFATSSFVTGKIYAANYAAPTPATLATAVADMEAAYADAAARTAPISTDVGTGEIGGMTLAPGLYKFTSKVTISSDVTLSGGPNDIWIFQIAEDLNQAAGTKVVLSGGALAKNVFWQVVGDGLEDTDVYIGENAHFEGVILSRNQISLGTKASMNGRLLSQTIVTLDQNTLTQPAP